MRGATNLGVHVNSLLVVLVHEGTIRQRNVGGHGAGTQITRKICLEAWADVYTRRTPGCMNAPLPRVKEWCMCWHGLQAFEVAHTLPSHLTAPAKKKTVAAAV
jgi:hypothetical protein